MIDNLEGIQVSVPEPITGVGYPAIKIHVSRVIGGGPGREQAVCVNCPIAGRIWRVTKVTGQVIAHCQSLKEAGSAGLVLFEAPDTVSLVATNRDTMPCGVNLARSFINVFPQFAPKV